MQGETLVKNESGKGFFLRFVGNAYQQLPLRRTYFCKVFRIVRSGSLRAPKILSGLQGASFCFLLGALLINCALKHLSLEIIYK